VGTGAEYGRPEGSVGGTLGCASTDPSAVCAIDAERGLVGCCESCPPGRRGVQSETRVLFAEGECARGTAVHAAGGIETVYRAEFVRDRVALRCRDFEGLRSGVMGGATGADIVRVLPE
jgi:hypothetical protein